MDKAPDAYRTISEVAEDLDLPQHVLRFWETRFGQIKPLKRGGGRRYYRPDDVVLLKGIRHLLYKEGYTIKGVQRILKEQGAKAVQSFVRDSLAEEDLPELQPALSAPTAKPDAYGPAAVSEAVPLAAAAPPVRQPAWEPEISRPASFDPAPTPSDDVPPVTSSPSPVAQPFDGFHERTAPDHRELLLPEKVSPVTPVAFEPVTAAPVGQVSMFRGGLQRGEGVAHSAPLTEFAAQMRERADFQQARNEVPSLGSRDALLMALDELVACRATIDQVLARRQN